jgi:23S rRNA (cytosine1962-C5)-methyltransferase
MKLERFGTIIVARPETQALWKKQKPELWETAHATFAFEEKKGAWDIKKPVPESWEMSRGPIKFLARLTSFKHTGIFPEQEPNWVWIKDRVKALSEQQEPARKESGRPEGGDPRTFSQQAPVVSVLNLFGYTGIATLAAAHPGASVTHVDASKQSLDWAHENARLSGIPEDKIRWIPDDALAFVKREVRRGTKYDGIILDPPAFGRGAKGEVWKIEEDFPALLAGLKEILSDKPGSFFLVNGYAAGYAPRSFAQAIESTFGEVSGECGEMHIKEASSDRVIPAGIYVRFIR